MPGGKPNVKREVRILCRPRRPALKRIVTHGGFSCFFPNCLKFPQTMDPATAARSPTPESRSAICPYRRGLSEMRGDLVADVLVGLKAFNFAIQRSKLLGMLT